MPVLVLLALWAAYTGFDIENCFRACVEESRITLVRIAGVTTALLLLTTAWFCIASQFRDPFQGRTMRRAVILLVVSLASTVAYFFLMATVSIATTT